MTPRISSAPFRYWPLVLVLAVSAMERVAVGAQPPPDEALLDLLVFGVRAETTGPLNFEPAVRTRVEAYLRQWERFETLLPNGPKSGAKEMAQDASIRYERRLASLSDVSGAPALAADYVAKLRPCYEWEGYHECPEAEAKFAVSYMAAHPQGPFNSYLPLLAAHRWLCTAEAYVYEKSPADEARSRREYIRQLTLARESSDPMIRAAAKTLAERNSCF